MELVRLIYVSSVGAEFELSSFEEILYKAQQNNSGNEVTGILYFNQHYFLQYLEGSAVKVRETYNRIRQDKRHDDVRILDESNIDKRLFGGWSMAYILDSDFLTPLNLRFMDSPEFNPYRLNAQSANEIIVELRRVLPLAYLNSRDYGVPEL